MGERARGEPGHRLATGPRPPRTSVTREARRGAAAASLALDWLSSGSITPNLAVSGMDALQHAAGNAATARLVAARGPGAGPGLAQRQVDPDGGPAGAAPAAEPEAPVEDAADVDEAVEDMAAGITELETDGENLLGERITITPDLLALTHPSFAKKHATPKIDDWSVEGYSYSTVKGSAFKKQAGDKLDISPSDIEQGVLGDCYLLSAMAAVARANPEAIRRLISGPDEKNKYSVTIYVDTGGWFKKSLTPKIVKVDPYVPTTKGGQPVLGHSPQDPGWTDQELWVLLIEKAYASVRGDYETIEGGFGAPAMEALTGQASKEIDTGDYTEIQIVSTIKAWLDMKYAVTASADWYMRDAYKDEARKKGIILEHEYSVVSVDKGKMTIDLQNPWGAANPIVGLPIADFKKYFRNFANNPVTKR